MGGRRLVVVSDRDHSFIDLDGRDVLRIGRSPDNDIVVKDDMVSRHHCQLHVAGDGQVRARDLKSFNGTYLNERRIREEPLVLWDALRVGRTKVILVERAETPAGEPAQRAAAAEDGDARAPASAGPAPAEAEDVEAQASQTRTMSLDLGGKELRGLVDDIVSRERAELEQQISKRIRDESGPQVLASLAGFKVRVRRMGPSDGGGDFFDVFREPLRPDELFLAAGSVSGVGIPACVAATAARHCLRGLVTVDPGQAPHKQLEALRDVLLHTLHPGSAVSLLLARLTAAGEVAVGCVGGTGALLYRAADAAVEVLRGPGRRDEEAARPEGLEAKLGAGDRLLLASDGGGALRRADGEPFGADRLRDAFAAASELSPKELVARLMEDYAAFAGEAPDRDVTLLAIAPADASSEG